VGFLNNPKKRPKKTAAPTWASSMTFLKSKPKDREK